MTDLQQQALDHAGSKLFRIRELVEGVGRTGKRNNGMDMLADAVLRILNESPPWVRPT